MLLLNPRSVTFGPQTWSNVQSVSIDREGSKVVTEIGDTGPFVSFADVPEQSVTVRVSQELEGDDLDDPALGDQQTLSFVTAPNSSAAGSKRVTMSAVVTEVRYEMSRKFGATRSVSLVAVSSDGATDPVLVQTL